ncbi:MAG TPA: ABC transporter permease [Terriglobales bacterium]
MSVAATADKFSVILLRDLRTASRYRAGLAISVAGTLVELAAFYYLSRAIGPGFRPDGVEYFPFLLIGTGLYTFMIMATRAFVRCVQEAQQEGTMEVLMASATPAPVIVLLSAAAALIAGSGQFLIYLIAGFKLSGTGALDANLAAAVGVFGLSLMIVVGLGLVAAALQIAIQKGSAVLWIVGSGTWFLTGTLFPVDALPKPLQIISGWIPLTHSLTAMRMALLQGSGFGDLAPEFRYLLLFAGAALTAGLVLFSLSLRKARLAGSLAFR